MAAQMQFTPMRSWSMVFLLGLSLISCESGERFFQNKKTTPEATNIPKKVLPVDVETHPDPALDLQRQHEDCRNFVREDKRLVSVKFPDDQTLDIEIDSNAIYDTDSLTRWVADFSTEIFADRVCPWQSILFIAGANAGSFYQGLSKRSDYGLFKKSQISAPEWYRRFEIIKMNTVGSLKMQLKQARQGKDHARATEVLTELMQTEGESPVFLLIKNNILLEQRLYHEAISGFKTVLAGERENLTALYNLAFAEKEVGSFVEAIQDYRNLLQILKNDSDSERPFTEEEAKTHLVDALLKNNQLVEAQAVLSSFTDQDSPSYRILFSNMLRAQGESSRALEVLQGIAESDAVFDTVLYNRVLLHLDLKDEVGAREAYTRLKEKNPDMAREFGFIPLFHEAAPVQTPEEPKGEDASQTEDDGAVPPLF